MHVCWPQVLPQDANEGELSVAKARLVRNLRLAQLGSNLPLLLQYQLRSHPFDNSLWTPDGSSSVMGLLQGGGKHTMKGKRIADGVESLIGAFYLAGAAREAAEATAGAGAAAAAGHGDGLMSAAAADGSNPSCTKAATAGTSSSGSKGGSASDAAAWVWHRVSGPGLVAAAALCEALNVLPAGDWRCWSSRAEDVVGLQKAEVYLHDRETTATAARPCSSVVGLLSSVLARLLLRLGA
jgi:hypothetical protein